MPNNIPHHSSHEHAARYVDPVCGMSTGDEKAFIRYEHEGKAYYFCSDACLAKFKGDPARFVTAGPALEAPLVPVPRRAASIPAPCTLR